ncbi:hypothetical protein [Streptomyces thermocarboxydovorans]
MVVSLRGGDGDLRLGDDELAPVLGEYGFDLGAAGFVLLALFFGEEPAGFGELLFAVGLAGFEVRVEVGDGVGAVRAAVEAVLVRRWRWW